MKKIILGLTGSVATTLAPKIVKSLQKICDEVVVVMTDKATHFYNPVELKNECGVVVYTDNDEWSWPSTDDFDMGERDMWQKGDQVLHIDLAKDACALVIAPATMNTIAKMSNGITDNLLTSIVAAWENRKPLVIAPAMNTMMWYSYANARNLSELPMRAHLVDPVEKKLACGDVGMGAMADIAEISRVVKELI